MRLCGVMRKQVLAARVARHDHDGVLEVDRAALAVGQPAVVEDLEQHAPHVGVRLLHLVEQHDAVRMAAHRLGELAALVVADVARRRADQARDRVLLLVLATCRCGPSLVSSSNRNSASARASSVLPTPVGPEEQEAADRPVRILEAGARAAHRGRDRGHRGVLTDHARAQAVLHLGRAARPRPRASCRPGCRSTSTTTAAMSSSVTSSRRKPPFARSCSTFAESSAISLLERGDRAEPQLGRAARSRRCAAAARPRSSAARASPSLSRQRA